MTDTNHHQCAVHWRDENGDWHCEDLGMASIHLQGGAGGQVSGYIELDKGWDLVDLEEEREQ